MNERLLKVRILNAKGHEEVSVGVEEAITLCSTQMTTGNKWARLINNDGTTDIQTDVTFFTGDVRETIARLESVSEIWMIAALRGGSPFRVGTRAWVKASDASIKGWETRRRREAKAALAHRKEAAFCQAKNACSHKTAPHNLCSGTTFSGLKNLNTFKPVEDDNDWNDEQNEVPKASSCSLPNTKVTYKVTLTTKLNAPVISVRPNEIVVNLLYGKGMIVEGLHALCLAVEGPIHNIIKGTLNVAV